ncbi:MAG UNVERIFIED_CONTAM: hypothetical protein LVR18_09665 [Planctomycetaceae bacterium]|jgi:hypothetical protein
MKLDTALYQLKNFPVTFLRSNLLWIAGYHLSETRTYYFGYHDNFTQAQGTNEGFKFAPQNLFAASKTTGIDGKYSTALRVHNVRMIPKTEDVDVSDIEPYVLDGTGPDLMVTGQLSGCVFVVQQMPTGLVVAHIQPGGNRQSGDVLRETIRLMGRFRGHGRVTKVFGIGKDYSVRAHVVGIRTGGTWHLYAQQVATGTGPVTGSVCII